MNAKTESSMLHILLNAVIAAAVALVVSLAVVNQHDPKPAKPQHSGQQADLPWLKPMETGFKAQGAQIADIDQRLKAVEERKEVEP